MTFSSAEDPKCGGTIESPTGVLRAPDSDNDGWYDAHANCLWVISAKKGTIIRYRAFVDAEESEKFARCRIDFLKVSMHDHYGYTTFISS